MPPNSLFEFKSKNSINQLDFDHNNIKNSLKNLKIENFEILEIDSKSKGEFNILMKPKTEQSSILNEESMNSILNTKSYKDIFNETEISPLKEDSLIKLGEGLLQEIKADL